MDRKANKKEDKSFTSEYCAINQKQKTGLKNTKNKKKDYDTQFIHRELEELCENI